MTSTADLEPAQLTQECGQLKERIVELEGKAVAVQDARKAPAKPVVITK